MMSISPSALSRFVEVIEVPFTARPQVLNVWLGDKEFSVRLYWLKPAECWVIDLSDVAGNLLISGIPLVTGADLFDQFQYADVRGGRLVVMSTDRPPTTVPGWGDLGITGHVYWRRRPDVR
jgi:hypothetical protein